MRRSEILSLVGAALHLPKDAADAWIEDALHATMRRCGDSPPRWCVEAWWALYVAPVVDRQVRRERLEEEREMRGWS